MEDRDNMDLGVDAGWSQGGEQRRTGAWLISLGNAVPRGDKLVNEDLGCVAEVAQAAKFFSDVRRLGKLEGSRLEPYRRDAGLSPKDLRLVLDYLEKTGRATIQRDFLGDEILAIEIADSEIEDLYDFAADYFEQVYPTRCARIAIGILDATMHLPIRQDILMQQIASGMGEDARDVQLAIKHLEVVGALQVTHEKDSGEPIVFNPLHFGNTNQDALETLSRLDSIERDKVVAIVEHVKGNPGVPLPSELRGGAYESLKACGIIDACVYTPRATEPAFEFPTLNNAWSRVAAGNTDVSGDLVHDAKALLASLRYGEYYANPGKGRIADPFVLLRALVRRGTVGPATSIGTDYPIIAAYGIVNIVENPLYPNRYSMELIKRDVAQPVLELLGGETDYDPGALPGEGLQGGYAFQPPEQKRAAEIKLSIAELRDQIIFEQLRRERRR